MRPPFPTAGMRCVNPRELKPGELFFLAGEHDVLAVRLDVGQDKLAWLPLTGPHALHIYFKNGTIRDPKALALGRQASSLSAKLGRLSVLQGEPAFGQLLFNGVQGNFALNARWDLESESTPVDFMSFQVGAFDALLAVQDWELGYQDDQAWITVARSVLPAAT